jgi:hypothetical protein
MTTNTLSTAWAGQTAAPIDPTTIRFKAIKAPASNRCDGCLFNGQTSRVCISACGIALAAGQPDCDDPQAAQKGSVIYVADGSDPRQMALLDGEH